MRKMLMAGVVITLGLGCERDRGDQDRRPEPAAKPGERVATPAPPLTPAAPPTRPEEGLGKPEAARMATGEEIAARYKDCMGFFSSRDEVRFRTCFADDVSDDVIDSGMPVTTGVDKIVDERAKPFWAAFPDLKVTPQVILVNGSELVSLDHMSGTNTGELRGAPPTGKKIGFFVVHMATVDPERRVAKRMAEMVDSGTMMGQLGMRPGPVRAPAEKFTLDPRIVVARDDQTERANVEAWSRGAEAWNRHDLKATLASYADDAIIHEIAAPKDAVGKKQIGMMFKELWGGFSDVKCSYTSVWGAGDWVFARGLATGTNDGNLPSMKLKRTGKPMAMNRVELARFEKGKVKEHWIFYSSTAMAMQLGLMPKPGATAPAMQK